MSSLDEKDILASDGGDQDLPQLSTETMNALLEFYKEQEERELKLQEINEGKIPNTFDENWVRINVFHSFHISHFQNLNFFFLHLSGPGGKRFLGT